MSTAIPVPPGAVVPAEVATAVPDEEIRVYGHSNLFYWWPVWVAGFILAFLTYLDGHVMAVVPAGTQVEQGKVMPGTDGQPRDVLVTPPGTTVPPPPGATAGEPEPRLLVSANNNYGVAFIGLVLLVIVITNFILRGLVSVIAVAAIALVILFVALMGWWDDVLAWLGGLDVRMNAGGYLAIAIPLFLIWCFSTFVYDRYVYLVVTRGQVRIRKEIGGGEVAVDSTGLLLEKKRDDLFRHWLLGLGSGDMHVKTGAPSNLDFELNNVLFVGTKIARIQDLLREKEVAHQTATA
jgi:hypothetical protein